MSTKLTADESAYIKKLKGRKRFKPSECYQNAQRLLLDDEENRLTYWEGFLDDGIRHAWLTINNKILDLTLDALEPKVGRYDGVSLDRKAVFAHIAATGEYGPLVMFRRQNPRPIESLKYTDCRGQEINFR